MTNPETADQPPAHWPEELRAAFWTAVNAPTYDESAAATLHLVRQLAGTVAEAEATQWPGPLADLIDPTRGAPAAVSVPPPAPRADALTAVRALHHPMQRGPFTICAHCSGWDGEWRCLGVVTDYPCPTLRALDGEPQPGGPCVAGEQQNETPEARRCVCPHPADEHSVYGCVDGCGCEWMPKRPKLPPMDPVHILGIEVPE